MNKRTYQRMLAEFRQLVNRIDRLNCFTVTDAFEKLSKQEKIWINEQLNAMKLYYGYLKKRIMFYFDKEVIGDGRPFTEDPAE